MSDQPSIDNADTLSAASSAALILNDGVTITSTSTPAVNGTYSCSDGALMLMQDQMNAILTSNAFADGSQALAWADMSGANHTFPVAQFKGLVLAAGALRAACAQYAQGITTTPPSNQATIP